VDNNPGFYQALAQRHKRGVAHAPPP
jgi:hypothetical protein